jgi:thiol-disulfide isomerase/thioredoxin
MKKAALILALVLLATYGCTGGGTSSTDSAPAAPKGPAPEFDLENIAGGKINSTDLKGKILVVDFWATWCEPCIVEIPKFNKMSDEYKGKPVEVVGITIESPYDDIKPKVEETGIKYTVLVGNDKVVEGFGGIFGFPTTFVVTKDFQIYRKYIGALPDKDARIKKDIERLLAAESAD